MAILLTLHAEVVARGVWCDVCLLPSAATINFYTLSELGVFPPNKRTHCTHCRKTT